jgi:hypothetical protein
MKSPVRRALDWRGGSLGGYEELYIIRGNFGQAELRYQFMEMFSAIILRVGLRVCIIE